jgi:transmembrane sensor
MTEADDRSTSAIREAAAEWVIRLGGAGVTPADKIAFATWLRRSPVHVKEYLQAEAAWSRVDEEAHGDPTELDGLLKQPEDNVVQMHARPAQPSAPLPPSDGGPAGAGSSLAEPEIPAVVSSVPAPEVHAVRRRSWRLGGAAIAAAIVLGVALILGPRIVERLDPNLISTGIGEQRRVVLADGSAVELNTRTRIRVKLSDAAREVQLIEGEAFFDVAKDPSRAFRVLSDTAVVRALGTQFNVYRRSHGTTVAVVEGRVAVDPADAGSAAPAPLEVAAGQVVQVDRRKVIQPVVTKPAVSVAWRQHRLIFEDETLEIVIAELNRYNTKPLAIADPSLATLRISGVFDPNRPGDLIGFLEQNGDARASVLDDQVLLIAP